MQSFDVNYMKFKTNCIKKNKPTCSLKINVCTHATVVYFNFHFSTSVQLDTQDGILLVDYSKNIITEETMKHLMNLVRIQ